MSSCRAILEGLREQLIDPRRPEFRYILHRFRHAADRFLDYLRIQATAAKRDHGLSAV